MIIILFTVFGKKAFRGSFLLISDVIITTETITERENYLWYFIFNTFDVRFIVHILSQFDYDF